MSAMLLPAAGSDQKKPTTGPKRQIRPSCKALLVGEGGAKRRMRGSIREDNGERFARGERPLTRLNRAAHD